MPPPREPPEPSSILGPERDGPRRSSSHRQHVRTDHRDHRARRDGTGVAASPAVPVVLEEQHEQQHDDDQEQDDDDTDRASASTASAAPASSSARASPSAPASPGACVLDPVAAPSTAGEISTVATLGGLAGLSGSLLAAVVRSSLVTILARYPARRLLGAGV